MSPPGRSPALPAPTSDGSVVTPSALSCWPGRLRQPRQLSSLAWPSWSCGRSSARETIQTGSPGISTNASMRIRAAAIAASIGVLGAAMLVFGFRDGHQISRKPAAVVSQSAAPTADPIQANEIVNVIPQDAKRALVDPGYVAAAGASDIQPSEEVIGVAINGDARALPLATLNVHEIVDDVIGGQPVAVTW